MDAAAVLYLQFQSTVKLSRYFQWASVCTLLHTLVCMYYATHTLVQRHRSAKTKTCTFTGTPMNTYGSSWMFLDYFHAFGPSLKHNEFYMVPTFFSPALCNTSYTLVGNHSLWLAQHSRETVSFTEFSLWVSYLRQWLDHSPQIKSS